jgi:hypothetical protein
MDGNTKGRRKPPNCSIRKTGAQQQDIGVELETRGGNGQEKRRRAIRVGEGGAIRSITIKM